MQRWVSLEDDSIALHQICKHFPRILSSVSRSSVGCVVLFSFRLQSWRLTNNNRPLNQPGNHGGLVMISQEIGRKFSTLGSQELRRNSLKMLEYFFLKGEFSSLQGEVAIKTSLGITEKYQLGLGSFF